MIDGLNIIDKQRSIASYIGNSMKAKLSQKSALESATEWNIIEINNCQVVNAYKPRQRISTITASQESVHQLVNFNSRRPN